MLYRISEELQFLFCFKNYIKLNAVKFPFSETPEGVTVATVGFTADNKWHLLACLSLHYKWDSFFLQKIQPKYLHTLIEVKCGCHFLFVNEI